MMGLMRETVVLLHGFAGTGRGWDPVVARLDAQRYTALTPDQRGHGARAGARPITFDAVAADVLALAPERFALCGYSMGGRIALHVALAAPERITHLTLVATTAGIDDEQARARRRADDAALAQAIEEEGLEAFAERWLAQPLFADDPPAAQTLARADIVRNDPAGLAQALRGIGTGAMEPLWDRLGALDMPATVLAGQRDAKFRELGERLAAGLPHAGTLLLARGAGHALPRVAPDAVAAAISR
jgi:2-succinyl-6-hydroxy-2,4-cyclohexadiene-1-carboxylate synthase